MAHTNQLVLVIHNLANYEDFEGLELEDWTRSSLGIKSGGKGFYFARALLEHEE